MRKIALVVVVVIAAGLGLTSCTATYTISSSQFDCTGTTDVTNALNSYLAGIQNDAVVNFPAGGSGGCQYRVEGSLALSGRSKITLHGNNVKIFADTDGAGTTPPDIWLLKPSWPRHRVQFIAWDSSDISLDNFNLRGSMLAPPYYDGSLEAQHAIEFAHCTRCQITGSKLHHVHGDGVSVTNTSDSVQVSGNEIYRIGRQGMTADSGTNILFDSNTLHEGARTAFDVEPGTGGSVSNITISNNTVTSAGTFQGNFLGANGAGYINELRFENNSTQSDYIESSMGCSSNCQRGNIYYNNNSGVVAFGSPVGLLRFWYWDYVEAHGNSNPMLTHSSYARIGVDAHCSNGKNASGQSVPLTDPTQVSVSGNNFSPGPPTITELNAYC